MPSLASLLEGSAQRYPAQVALIEGDVRTTYEELWYDALRVAADLLPRVRPGERVVLQLPNGRDWVAAYYAILSAGAVAVPLHVAATDRERDTVVRDSGAALVLREVTRGATTATVVERADDDPAAILYTSGTSGDPKGVVLTHGNLLSNAVTASRDVARFTADDVMLVTVQFAHAFGMTSVLNACLYAGASLVIGGRWSGESGLALSRRHDVTVLRGVPTIYVDLLAALGGDAGPPLRAVFSGGASLAPAVLERVEAAFATTVWEGYGLTEASPLVACNQVPFGRRAGTVGHAVPGVYVELLQPDGRRASAGGTEGEIVVRGPNVMAGYWGRPADTAAAVVDGWLHTGDVGRFDADGFLRVVDRTKDVIKRGGAAVYPREVEDVLVAHPAVRGAAVVGSPDDRLGQVVTAFVVGDVDEHTLNAWCRAAMASYKCPARFVFVKSLPLGPTGKVLKRQLREGTVDTSAAT